MKQVLSVLGVAVLSLGLASGAAAAHAMGGHHGGGFHGGGFHGPFFHGHPGTHVFIGGSLFFDPFLYPYYAAPYPYPVYAYPPPPPPEMAGVPPEETEEGGVPEGTEEQHAEEEEAARRANYGLAQLRGVPDGAAVDLDGRFWLTAQALDDRWLALPEGRHTITVHVQGSAPAERQIDVKPGATHVVRFGPFPAGAARG